MLEALVIKVDIRQRRELPQVELLVNLVLLVARVQVSHLPLALAVTVRRRLSLALPLLMLAEVVQTTMLAAVAAVAMATRQLLPVLLEQQTRAVAVAVAELELVMAAMAAPASSSFVTQTLILRQRPRQVLQQSLWLVGTVSTNGPAPALLRSKSWQHLFHQHQVLMVAGA